jgi:hypothetical protein
LAAAPVFFSSVRSRRARHPGSDRPHEYFLAFLETARGAGVFRSGPVEIGRVNRFSIRGQAYNNENTVFMEYDWDRAIAPRFSLS